MASSAKRVVKKTSTAKQTRTSKKKDARPSAVPFEITSLVLLAISIYILLTVSRYEGKGTDYQFIGLAGAFVVRSLKLALGHAAAFLPVFLGVWAYLMGSRRRWWPRRMNGLALVYLGIAMVCSLRGKPLGMLPWEAGQAGMGGGVIGGGLTTISLALGGKVGTDILIVLCLVVGCILFCRTSPSAVVNRLIAARKQLRPAGTGTREKDTRTLPQPMPEAPIQRIPPSFPQVPTREENPPVFEPVRVEERPAEARAEKRAIRRPADDGEYVKPDLSLLNEVKEEKVPRKSDIKENVKALEDTFSQFGLQVKVSQVSCGPAVTRYEILPAPGVKVSKIVSLTDDLQLSLAARGIRIEAPIPGKSAVGIEVPNDRPQSVGLQSLLATPAFTSGGLRLPIVLGRDVTGNPVISDLTDMPHLLIAGSTGSGKSVCLNTLLIGLLYALGPQRLKLVLIDPKMVELTVYNGLPHLMVPVVTDVKKSALVLRWMVNEMEKRYRLFAEAGARDIYRYNEIAGSALPYIVVVIDELADLMMAAPVEVEDSICRLAQMARAAGIHLVVATQRPSVDVVTGIIKANMPSRIAFAVSSQADSRTILDMGGAEKLLGRGDMLFFPVGAAKPHRVQGAFVSDEEIERVTNFIRARNVSLEQMQAEITEEELESSLPDADDELFWEAVKVFVDTGKASASLLQRRLRIGFTRAARLVDIMEERGIVSPPDVNKRREILIDEHQLERLMSGRPPV